ncbi:hypothetical protein EP10_001428 [Geobacillus icigianus]|uniref:Uncharacterized protein n=1 Tax=Geobacillus icigianus TaxID=1430331 RepID=A0ABU6BFG8_9BACL|nr:hypothetical protein B4113_0260 [Geobacillus sp. B4113_201601]MEB3750587.1 hypothetical protein [Geobacillus icigianus]
MREDVSVLEASLFLPLRREESRLFGGNYDMIERGILFVKSEE